MSTGDVEGEPSNAAQMLLFPLPWGEGSLHPQGPGAIA
jgi:hypothetical protein